MLNWLFTREAAIRRFLELRCLALSFPLVLSACTAPLAISQSEGSPVFDLAEWKAIVPVCGRPSSKLVFLEEFRGVKIFVLPGDGKRRVQSYTMRDSFGCEIEIKASSISYIPMEERSFFRGYDENGPNILPKMDISTRRFISDKLIIGRRVCEGQSKSAPPNTPSEFVICVGHAVIRATRRSEQAQFVAFDQGQAYDAMFMVFDGKISGLVIIKEARSIQEDDSIILDISY